MALDTKNERTTTADSWRGFSRDGGRIAGIHVNQRQRFGDAGRGL